MEKIREKFIELIESYGWRYELQENNIVIVSEQKYNHFYIDEIQIPSDVIFNNKGSVDLNKVTIVPEGVVFQNSGNVYLESVTTISPGVIFRNKGILDLPELKNSPDGVVFQNSGSIRMSSLLNLSPDVEINSGGSIKTGRFITTILSQELGIPDIEFLKIFNSMIKSGVFNR